MDTLLNLKELGARLKKLDLMLMAGVKRRMELVLDVGRYKRRVGEDIVRLDIEDGRIKLAKEFAEKHHLNPHFMGALFYLLIDESCKVQLEQLEKQKLQNAGPQSEDEWYASLKANLLILTERWCESYDQEYERHAFATKAYLQFERTLMEREIAQLSDQTTVVDLGCATGRLSYFLMGHFERLFGYDISQHMIAMARRHATDDMFDTRASYDQVDIEEGVPLADASASFVVMNFGTASDVRNIERVLAETMRVLKPGGRIFFSFYNREALLYRWDFLPWTVGLTASINLVRNCLDVHLPGEVLSVYARPYSVLEIEAILKNAGVNGVQVSTYPTVSSILPDDLFEDQLDIQRTIAALDADLSNGRTGAYIIATGQK